MEEERSLFPVVDIPDFEEDEEEYENEYKPSIRWDLEKGDFVRNTENRVEGSEGLEAFKTWCIKTVMTERYSCLAYDDDMGTEMDEARQEDDENATELAMERTIEEALAVNPLTEAVEDFSFSWEADSVQVALTVVAVGWESFSMEVTLDR